MVPNMCCYLGESCIEGEGICENYDVPATTITTIIRLNCGDECSGPSDIRCPDECPCERLYGLESFCVEKTNIKIYPTIRSRWGYIC